MIDRILIELIKRIEEAEGAVGNGDLVTSSYHEGCLVALLDLQEFILELRNTSEI